MLCDSETTNVTKAQIGFINFIVKPTFECVISLFPDIAEYYVNINKNLKRYEDKFEEENKKKEKEEKSNLLC